MRLGKRAFTAVPVPGSNPGLASLLTLNYGGEMILIDEKGEEHKHTFGNSVTGRHAKEIIIRVKDLATFEPLNTINYIQCILASRLLPGGKISIVLDNNKKDQ